MIHQATKEWVTSLLQKMFAKNPGNPVGTIISLMGKTAPTGYLACDGTEYNIADHKILAGYFAEQFGKSNYFGGDGETTFAVPNLQGEFLRGTGTNSHTNQGSGADAGVHQDSTEIPFLRGYIPSRNAQIAGSDILKYDTGVDSGTMCYSASGNTYGISPSRVTIRPTNTSVLYCIKY